jgi:hypothetical protein
MGMMGMMGMPPNDWRGHVGLVSLHSFISFHRPSVFRLSYLSYHIRLLFSAISAPSAVTPKARAKRF